MALRSWDCKGCTRICYIMQQSGEIGEYCRYAVEHGRIPTRWKGDYVYCTKYSTDPKHTDKNIRMFVRSS